MRKLNSASLDIGARISISEDWRLKISKFGSLESIPKDYVISEVASNNFFKEEFYVCDSVEEVNGKRYRFALEEFVIKYLFADKVEDTNIGFYFDEFLPDEDTQILITNARVISEVIPATISVQPELATINKESLICLKFSIDLINGRGSASIRYYLNPYSRYTWKFLKHPDTSYMTDYEKIFQDTLIHKELVIESCNKLADYLDREGAHTVAGKLRERAIVHDNSKIINQDELVALSKIINDKSTLRDSSVALTPVMKDAIKLHWQNNSHHPEHFDSVIDMSRLDIMEMCCDWHARSIQYGSEFLNFVKQRQEERFHFPDWMFAEIWHYCNVLNS